MKTPPGYEILEQLGDGGQGEVFKARQIHLDRIVALKTAKPTASGKSFSQNLERLLREARTIAKFDHPNIVRVFDCFVFEDCIYIVMEFLDGHPLNELLEARSLDALQPFHRDMMQTPGRLRDDWSLVIGVMIARALEYSHGHGIYHRDLKPSNIFITRTGEIKLFDFSIARDEKFKGLTATGVVIGSPPYMCPEQVKGEVSDARSDLYSFGCVMYHCVTGGVPFDEPSEIMVCIAHMEKIPRSPAQVRPDIMPRLAGVILRLMEKEKEARFQSALELEETLMEDFGEQIETLSAKVYPRTSQSRISRIVVEKPITAADAAIPPKKPRTAVGSLFIALGSIALIAAFAGIYAFAGKGIHRKAIAESQAAANPAANAISPEETRKIAATNAAKARLKETKDNFNRWFVAASKDDALVLSGITADKLLMSNNPVQPVTLEVTNANSYPAEVSYYVERGTYYVEGIDTADSWKPYSVTLDLGGNGFGSAFGGAPILIPAKETHQLDLVPRDIPKIPPVAYKRFLKLYDLHLAGTASAASIAESAPSASERKTGPPVALPPNPPDAEELPAKLDDDPILKAALLDTFDVRSPDGEKINSKVAVMSRQESAENFLQFLKLTQSATDGGRLLDPSLVQVRGIQVDSLTGSIDLMLEIDTSGRTVEVTAFVARGSQRLTLIGGEKPQTVGRTLRGVITGTSKFRATEFRERKRLPLIDLFRKDTDPGVLSFQESNEIRIDRLLLLCAYTREDKPADAKSQPFGYKVVTGLRTAP